MVKLRVTQNSRPPSQEKRQRHQHRPLIFTRTLAQIFIKENCVEILPNRFLFRVLDRKREEIDGERGNIIRRQSVIGVLYACGLDLIVRGENDVPGMAIPMNTPGMRQRGQQDRAPLERLLNHVFLPFRGTALIGIEVRPKPEISAIERPHV